MPIPHWIFDGANSGVFLLVAWAVIRRINRDETLKKDYPPHRHINGKVIYPKEYQPARTENLGGSGAD